MKQSEQIASARELLQPKEVKLHKIPRWLSKKLRKRELDLEAESEWLDHWGTCGEDFVSEPYHLTSSTARALDRFCDRLGGVEWSVSSNTWWYPGNTIRITIKEKMNHGY